MKCTNCNSDIPDDSAFCPVCGTKCGSQPAEPQSQQAEPQSQPVELQNQQAEPQSQPVEPQSQSAEPQSQPAEPQSQPAESQSQQEGTPGQPVQQGQYVQFTDTQPQGQIKKGKGGKIALIVVAAVLAVIVGVGAVAHAQIGNFVRKTFTSASSYYQHVEKANCEDGRKTLSSYYDTVYENLTGVSGGKEVSYTVELGNTLKTMLSITGKDFSKLDKVQIKAAGGSEGDVNSGQLTALVNDTQILTANMLMDFATKEGYLQIPEISEKYLDFSSALQQSASSEDFQMMTSLEKYLPETKKIEDIYDTYTNLVIENMEDVKKSSEELKVGSVAKKYTKLTVTCNAAKFTETVKETLETIKTDNNIKEIVEAVDASEYANMVQTIDSMLASVNSGGNNLTDKQFMLTMDVYVNNVGEIKGRIINLVMDGQMMQIRSVRPEKGSSFGYECSVAMNGKQYGALTGSGTIKGGKLSGDFTLGISEEVEMDSTITDPSNLLNIKVEDFDEDALKDGYLNGTFTLSSKAIPMVASYGLKVEAKGSKNTSSTAFSVVCGEDVLATLRVESSDGGEVTVKKPDAAAKVDMQDETAMMSYIGEWKVKEFFAKLQEASGIDLSDVSSYIEQSLLGSSVSGLEQPGNDFDGYSMDSNSTEGYGDSDDSYGTEDYDDSSGDDSSDLPGLGLDDQEFDDGEVY